jgi:ABC-type phosphate/phosphonate transport system permease subunit
VDPAGRGRGRHRDRHRGRGGIGFILSQSTQVLAYRATGAIIISTFAVVLLIEILTNWIRKQLI